MKISNKKNKISICSGLPEIVMLPKMQFGALGVKQMQCAILPTETLFQHPNGTLNLRWN